MHYGDWSAETRRGRKEEDVMLRRSEIGWCDYSGGDLNFVIGCTPVSEGCANCYGRRWAARAGRDFAEVRIYWEKLNRLWKAKWEPGDKPYRRGPGSRPIMFPVDLGDLFHPEVPEQMILSALDIFAARDDADWVVLTKRPERMLDVTSYWLDLNELEWLPGNVWCMVTCENQRRADERIPVLLRVKARVRGVSMEPMLEAIILQDSNVPVSPNGPWPDEPLYSYSYLRGICGDERVNWVIVGAESGPGRRGFEVGWAEGVYEQCRAAEVAFFGKQASGVRPGVPLLIEGREIKEFPGG